MGPWTCACSPSGPVQENCFLLPPRGLRPRADRRPRRGGPTSCSRAIDALGVTLDGILLTHTHFDHVGAVAPVAQGDRAPRCGCPEIEKPVLADIMSYVPWAGFGPYESWDAEHTLSGRRAARAGRLRDRRALHARPQPRPRDLLDPGRAGDLLRRRALPGLGRPRRPARRRLAHAARVDPRRCVDVAARARPTVYPGHMGITTLGAERATNPFLAELARDR